MIKLFTDGSCLSKKGSVGAAYAIFRDSKLLELLGVPMHKGNPHNSEIMAALLGLKACISYAEDNEQIIVISDSKLLVNGMARCESFAGHVGGSNYALWKVLASIIEELRMRGCIITSMFVRGHNGNVGNLLCDRAARTAAESHWYIRG